MIINDKRHWYDGKFYDNLIAPNQDKLFTEIRKIISKDSSVIDVGCGTGRLSFQFSDYCKKVVGLDLSSKNISVAENNLKINPKKNISFIHGDVNKVGEHFSEKFDYAIMTYVIHEMPEHERVKVLTDLKKIANKIIIGDYIAPTPKTIWGGINVIVEYFAGKDHYNNFKSYVKNGGLDYLVRKANFKKVFEIKNKPQTAHLVVAE